MSETRALLQLRMPPELKERVEFQAAQWGISQNTLIVDMVVEGVKGMETGQPVMGEIRRYLRVYFDNGRSSGARSKARRMLLALVSDQ